MAKTGDSEDDAMALLGDGQKSGAAGADENEEQAGFLDRLEEAAIQAEYDTGWEELTEDGARRSVIRRVLTIIVGFIVTIIGIILLPLPGPGWVVIAGGFSILAQEFVWAEKTVRYIRKKIPGIPEDGKIPTSQKIMIAVITVVFATVSIVWNDEVQSITTSVKDWLFGLF